MRRCIFFILLAALPLLSRADGEHGDKDKDEKQCRKEECRPRIHSIEEFGFMVPPPSASGKCRDQKVYHRAIVNFYRWYLNNRHAIVAGLSEPDKHKDLLPPFHVSYETLHRFYQLIREKYPDWISDLVPDTNALPVLPAPAAKASADVIPSANTARIVADTLSAI